MAKNKPFPAKQHQFRPCWILDWLNENFKLPSNERKMEYGNVTHLTTYAQISLNRVFAVSSVETCANEVSEYDQEIQQSQTADQPRNRQEKLQDI